MGSEAKAIDAEPRESGVWLRETRQATAEALVGRMRWQVVLDGPRFGTSVQIFWRAAVGWRLWGFTEWVGERIEHRTGRFVDLDVTAALERALRAELAGA